MHLLRGDGRGDASCPAGDDFFQFVTEAIDDFSYQNILSVEMMHYDGVADGCQETMAYLGRMQNVFPQGTFEKNMPVQTA